MMIDCLQCDLKSRAARSLSENELNNMASTCAKVHFKKGENVIKQGSLSTNIVYLRKGLAKLHIKGPYHEQIVKIAKAPLYMGLPTTVGDKINQYSITIVEDSEVCFIDVNTFKSLLRSNSQFSYSIIIELCKNELDSFNRCTNRTQKQVRGRLADMLLDFSENIYGSDVFKLPVSQEEIGNMVDSSRETVSRVFTEFEKDGIISVNKKKVSIVNKAILNAISENG
jgi:CRP/FNR family transcriptional regulator